MTKFLKMRYISLPKQGAKIFTHEQALVRTYNAHYNPRDLRVLNEDTTPL